MFRFRGTAGFFFASAQLVVDAAQRHGEGENTLVVNLHAGCFEALAQQLFGRVAVAARQVEPHLVNDAGDLLPHRGIRPALHDGRILRRDGQHTFAVGVRVHVAAQPLVR